MVASVFTHPDEAPGFTELLRPDLLADGMAPEERIVFSGISWKRYLKLDKLLGDDRPGPRFYYLNGNLEIMTTSNEHERIKKLIAGILEIYFEHIGIEIFTRGQATMRDVLRKAGAEPDDSWCLGKEKKFPDLVLEIALTSGGINKLQIYREFKVPEVWFWRRKRLEIFGLNRAGNYVALRKSRLLPKLDIALIEDCASIQSWNEARQTFRAGLSTSR
jgi:Uma2 family endonuclease